MDLHGNAAISWSAGASSRAASLIRAGRPRRRGAIEQEPIAGAVAARPLTRAADADTCGFGRRPLNLRRLRMTAAEIAETLTMPLTTVSGILTRLGAGRLGRLGLEPAVRYERSRPGELVHVDIKTL